ncbi:MAG: NAD(P)/FAD-dependent oxidoreductase [Spirosomataceae bacterium]
MAVQGKTTFKEEFVTCGGVQLDGLHAKTMESRQVRAFFSRAKYSI